MFLLNRGEIERRFDANFYLREFYELNNKLTIKYGSHQLKSVISEMYRYPTFYNIEYTEKGIPVIKGESINKEGIINPTQEFDYINEETHNKFPKTELKENDLIFTVRGLIGKVGIFEGFSTVGNINANVIKIRIKDEFNHRFFWIFLNSSIGQKLINRISSGQVQQTITVPDILNLPIALPSIEIQNQIVNYISNAYADKKAKEAEAREKLASVDGLVLDALGIALPEQTADTLEKRIFFTKSSDISNGRFDAAIYQKKFSLQSNLYPMAKLKDVYAINPPTSFAHFRPETLLSFIPMEAISDELGKVVRHYERPVEESKGYTWFKENDVLWAKITPCMQNGKSAVAKNLLNGYGFGSTEYHVFRSLSENANPVYLYSILRLKSLRQAAMNYFGGSAGHQRVDVDFFKSLQIPIPPLEIQTEIAERVEAIYSEAKRLREEGALILKDAKAEVERMILGEG